MDAHAHVDVEVKGLDIKKLTRSLAGQRVSHVEHVDSGGIAVHFENGTILVVERNGETVEAILRELPASVRSQGTGPKATRRQRDYLEFIAKYMTRFGVAPAESDIARHFMVSAPSVHSMIKSLEGRGLITRERDFFTGQVIPRSIRLVVDVF